MSESEHQETSEHDPHFEPIVNLPLVEIVTNEENEEELVKIRARLYRYDVTDHEWKVSINDCIHSRPLLLRSLVGCFVFLKLKKRTSAIFKMFFNFELILHIY